MKNSKKWFSIIMWMFLTIIMSLWALVILSYIIPFARDTRWIENATNAYYQAYGWLEESLTHIKTRTNLTTETSKSMPTDAIWYSYQTYSNWSTIPDSWYWNSDYDKEYNIISPIRPVQLQIWNNYVSNWNSVNFYFQVPEEILDKHTFGTSLSWTTQPIINWLLSSNNDTLIADETYFTADQINGLSPCNLGDNYCKINNRDWLTLGWTWVTFWDFYLNNCNSNPCTLRLWVVNNLVLTNGTQIPYLEYKIEFNTSVPLRYTRIESKWKSFWFSRDIEVRVPQQTINQAFDFTVFQ